MKYTISKNNHVYAHEEIKIRYNIDNHTARITAAGKDIKRVNVDRIEEQQFVESLFDEFSAVNDTLSNLIDQYLTYHSTRKSLATMKQKEIYQGYIKKYFKFNPHNIDRLDIISGLNLVQEKHSAGTRNRCLKEFRLLIDFGIENGLIREKYNVLRHVKFVEVPESDKRPKKFFELQKDVDDKSQHTIQRLLEFAETPQQRLLIILLANTGARIMEIMRLKWSDIYWQDTGNNEGTWAINIPDSKKRKNGDNNLVTYRQTDISLSFYNAMMEQKLLIDNKVNALRDEYKKSHGKKNRLYFEETSLEANEVGYSDSRAEFKWKWIITNEYGNAPGYSTGRSWYMRMWKKAYEKYKDDPVHPWMHGPKPDGLPLHAFRRYFTTEFREYFNANNEYTKSIHEKLQQKLGHTVGSPVTDRIYTEWDSKSVVDSKLNSVVNIDLI